MHYLIENEIKIPFVSQGYYNTYFLFCKYPKTKSMQSTLYTFSNFDLSNCLCFLHGYKFPLWVRFASVGEGQAVKSKIVNSCARGLYTHFMFILYAFGSRTERSELRQVCFTNIAHRPLRVDGCFLGSMRTSTPTGWVVFAGRRGRRPLRIGG